MVTITRWTGTHARILREVALRMNIYEFAAHTNLSTSTIRDMENKGERTQLRTSTQRILDETLATASETAQQRFTTALAHTAGLKMLGADDVGVLAQADAGTAIEGASPTPHPILGDVRSRLVARRWQGAFDSPVAMADLKQVAVDAHVGHVAYQRADYVAAAGILTATAETIEQFLLHRPNTAHQHAHRVLALAYIGTSKLAAKLGDASMAWITADRAATAARLAEDPVLAAAASYQIACALLGMPRRIGDATEVVAVADAELHRIGSVNDPVALSIRGMLALIAAIVAARKGDSSGAARRLLEAERLATELGHDDNHMFTAFGPTNVMIHQVSVAIELQQPQRAISIADQLDTSRMPATLLSRRAQVHLDLATALAKTHNGDSPAVLHLLEAERIAPQVIGTNHRCRALLTQLIRRERRSATPGLRSLAQRAGVLA